LNRGIGTGYLPVGHTRAGTPLEVRIRGRAQPARVVKTPFYKEGTRR
jgi:glycine cleavage system aminomethyltransferase T